MTTAAAGVAFSDGDQSERSPRPSRGFLIVGVLSSMTRTLRQGPEKLSTGVIPDHGGEVGQVGSFPPGHQRATPTLEFQSQFAQSPRAPAARRGWPDTCHHPAVGRCARVQFVVANHGSFRASGQPLSLTKSFPRGPASVLGIPVVDHDRVGKAAWTDDLVNGCGRWGS